MTSKRAYRVVVRHNLVVAVESIEVPPDTELAEDNLSVSLKLAENFRLNGSVDGDYLFAGVNRAKDFALVALDFVNKLTEKSEHGLSQHNFYEAPTWSNASVGPKQKMQH